MAGSSNIVTANSKTNSASTTSKAVPGVAGITTWCWSFSRMPSFNTCDGSRVQKKTHALILPRPREELQRLLACWYGRSLLCSQDLPEFAEWKPP